LGKGKEQGMYRIDHDARSGVVQVTLSGELREKLHDAFHAELTRKIAAGRAGGRPLHLLVDVGELETLPADVVTRVTEAAAMCRSRLDRLAIIVRSSVVKLQLRQIVDGSAAELRTFLSHNAARTWLLAYAGAAAA
jgi:hypothetical protein